MLCFGETDITSFRLMLRKMHRKKSVEYASQLYVLVLNDMRVKCGMWSFLPFMTIMNRDTYLHTIKKTGLLFTDRGSKSLAKSWSSFIHLNADLKIFGPRLLFWANMFWIWEVNNINSPELSPNHGISWELNTSLN